MYAARVCMHEVCKHLCVLKASLKLPMDCVGAGLVSMHIRTRQKAAQQKDAHPHPGAVPGEREGRTRTLDRPPPPPAARCPSRNRMEDRAHTHTHTVSVQLCVSPNLRYSSSNSGLPMDCVGAGLVPSLSPDSVSLRPFIILPALLLLAS